MRRWLVGTAASALLLAAGTAAVADQGAASVNRIDLALIGDTPYGPAQLEAFPDLIDAINRDPKVRLVAHVGDIKNGSTRCDDSYFAAIAQHFATFRDPLVYTPGDNEWTDCHRVNNGAYDPLERLAKLRSTFFAEPGKALGGRHLSVEAQDAVPENQLWSQSRVVFAAVHAVGSDNGYAPWTGNTAATPAQRAEVDARIAAALAWIDRAFDRAAAQDAAGVALLMQADTFAGTNETLNGFDEIVAAIGARAVAFGRPVLLLQGDTHRYLVDQPYPSAPNLTRVVVEGETAAEWLRVSVDPRSAAVFSWEREFLAAG
jgi:hypothetical protein